MQKNILVLMMVLVFGVVSISSSVVAKEVLTKSEVENIVASFLKQNPEVLVEALENYRVKQEQMQQASVQEKISKYRPYLEDKDAPAIGNPDADVTVVEFFDYNCGYCRRAVPDIQELVKQDKNVRFVFHEMPILSSNSNDIAKWSLAAHEQGKYFDFHAALMMHRGSRNSETMKEIATTIGLDADRLENDAGSSKVEAALQKGLAVAREVGIQGTPAFIINGELYPGYLGPEGLRQAIESARQKL